MICKNCGAYYVRPPCPSCGMNGDQQEDKSEGKKQTDVLEMTESSGSTQKSSQVMIQRNKETKQRSGFQQTDQEENDEDEQLVKPSSKIDRDAIPSFQRIEYEEEEDEQLVRPSQRVAQQMEEKGDLPSFKKYEQEVRDQQISRDVKSIQRKTTTVSVHETKLKNDVEYRRRVKETLVEVMDLLEKLIEE